MYSDECRVENSMVPTSFWILQPHFSHLKSAVSMCDLERKEVRRLKHPSDPENAAFSMGGYIDITAKDRTRVLT